MVVNVGKKLSLAACAFLVIGCRTTKPTAAPTGAMQKSAATASATSVPPVTGKPEVLQWVVVTPPTSAVPEGDFAWNVDLRTNSEIWCERSCSKFELVESVNGDINELQAVKNTIAGNTKPGMLAVTKEIRGHRAVTHKVRIANVGSLGQSVVIEDVISKDRPNFYAVPMLVSRRKDGDKTILQGDFNGKKFPIRMEPNQSEPAVELGSEPLAVFAMGSFLQESAADGATSHVFIASKIVPLASQD